jgi:probable addiction module antidote protein
MNTKKTIKVSDLPVFDVAEQLTSNEDIANYLSAVIADGDPQLFVAALGDIAKARGMSQIAKDSGLAREALYKALRPNSQPRFDTISRVCAALGLSLQAHPTIQPV